MAGRWVTRWHPGKVEPIGPHVFLWTGLDQGCFRNHFWGARDLQFTDFRGKPDRRGRVGRATGNQVTAGHPWWSPTPGPALQIIFW